MSLQVHNFFARYGGATPRMIVDGDDIVAHVHNPDYLSLFLHAPEMRAFIERIARMHCDLGAASHDSQTCVKCQARVLLANMREPIEATDTDTLEALG